MHGVKKQTATLTIHSKGSASTASRTGTSSIRNFADRRALAKLTINKISQFAEISHDTKNSLYGGFEGGKIDLRTLDAAAINNVSTQMWANLAECTLSRDGKKPEILLPASYFVDFNAGKIPAELRAAIEAGLLVCDESEITMAEFRNRENGLRGLAAPVIGQLNEEEIIMQSRLFKHFLNNDLDNNEHGQYRVADITISTKDGNFSFERTTNLPKIDSAIDSRHVFQSGSPEEELLMNFVGIILQKQGQLTYIKNNINHLNCETHRTVISVEFSPERDAGAAGFHKDGTTDGRYLFATLVYQNLFEMVSAEHVPDCSLDVNELNLPQVIRSHLNEEAQRTTLSPPEYLQCEILPPHAVFSWCDVLNLHSTPYLSSRAVDSSIAKEIILKNLTSMFGRQMAEIFLSEAEGHIRNDPSSLDPGAMTEKYGKAAILLSSATTVYPDDLRATGIDSEVIESMFDAPQYSYHGDIYQIRHVEGDEISFIFNPVQNPRKTRWKRSASEGQLQHKAAKNYPKLRPPFMRIYVQSLPV
jgi:hypothetical protein